MFTQLMKQLKQKNLASDNTIELGPLLDELSSSEYLNSCPKVSPDRC
jgi:hypothetical protein